MMIKALLLPLSRSDVSPASAAVAQSMPDTENGRYALSPVANGCCGRHPHRGSRRSAATRARLGLLPRCPTSARHSTRKSAGCRRTIEALKASWRSANRPVTGKIDEPATEAIPLKKPDPKVAEGERKSKYPADDRDMDRMMAFVEQAWRRLVEMATGCRRTFPGKIEAVL